jgi:hypothetical protein
VFCERKLDLYHLRLGCSCFFCHNLSPCDCREGGKTLPLVD